AQPQLAIVRQAPQHARGAVLHRCALLEQLHPPGAHQVGEEGERLAPRGVEIEQQQLAVPADARGGAARGGGRRGGGTRAPWACCSGGSNVLSTFRPGVVTDSMTCPGSAWCSLRAVISISGSSGTLVRLVACRRMDAWVEAGAAEIARRAARALGAPAAGRSSSRGL